MVTRNLGNEIKQVTLRIENNNFAVKSGLNGKIYDHYCSASYQLCMHRFSISKINH
jgi:hypothetical protein